ncbi:putative phosphate transporter family protein [Candidatus Nitrososphaera gargensis Ga9.2]|uniref:Putative phosphate transporter family protein n=1 Tax=Nitrososphaera gargensis (strain Ga9.2) TaxID=1237085 RepID=K0ILA4_NITGG|nr:putative phosphate transporter family protein [Candidatus Nitrososphaera gargensis Ga9.2]
MVVWPAIIKQTRAYWRAHWLCTCCWGLAGTFFGGWRIVKTMAFRLTSRRPYQGFCAETGGGAILTSMAWLGIPVNTTHAISGAIMGAGATKRLSAIRWSLGRRIVYAWIIMIPASAALAAATCY